jgi:hypothetical protein
MIIAHDLQPADVILEIAPDLHLDVVEPGIDRLGRTAASAFRIE